MKQDKNSLLEEAIRIGDDILSRKIVSEEGFSWKTMSLDNSKNITFDVSESIYKGVGGIVLFFIELYKQTSDEKYFQAAVKGADWLINEVKFNPTSNYAFFTGRMGLTYVFIQMYKLTKEQKYLDEAVIIANKSTDFLAHSRKVDDLINGVSGILLGLLILHSETREKKLLPKIDLLTQHLIDNVQHGSKGIYWDKNPQQIRGLCGFSHGAAGVGYVFMQLGYYFDNPSFYWVAEEAFSYENHFFNKRQKNWPDFRKGIFNEDDLKTYKEAYLKGDMDFFFSPGNMMAWCHGAPGIGLSRLHAWTILEKEYLKKDFKEALASTKKSALSILSGTDSFNLCHGKGGNAMLFLEAHKCLGSKNTFQWARTVAQQAISFKKEYGFYIPGFNLIPKAKKYQDYSLFLGNAGIGYFYLMCNNPNLVPSILALGTGKTTNKVTIRSLKALNIGVIPIKKKILSRAYPGTISSLEKNYPKQIKSFLDSSQSTKFDIKYCLNKYLNDKEFGLSHFNQQEILELHELEKKKMEMELSVNLAFQNIKTMLLTEEAEKLFACSNEKLLQVRLKLNKDVQVHKISPSFSYGSMGESDENPHGNAKSQLIILFNSPHGIDEFRVPAFVKEILMAFSKPKKIKEAMETLLSDFGADTGEDREKFEKFILSQIKECIRSLFLLTA